MLSISAADHATPSLTSLTKSKKFTVFPHHFLGASSNLYMRACPSVRMFIRISNRMSVCPLASKKTRRNRLKLSGNDSHVVVTSPST